MLNARNGFVVRIATLLAFLAAPAFLTVAADDQGKKDAPMDLNARMQQKLDSRLNGNIGNGGSLDLDSKLSDRVNEKSAQTNKQLDDSANALTEADRSGKNWGEGEDAEDSEDAGE